MKAPVLFLSIAWAVRVLGAGVVLNEISHHPPDGRDDLQFVELHNPGAMAVDLSSCKFSAGIKYVFPAGTQISAGGFLVVAKGPKAIAAHFRIQTAVGPFGGTLKHGGERIALSDASGNLVDTVKFADRAPWPISPDGSGPTLERVCGAAPGDDPANWAASFLPERETPSGTPGKPDSRAQANVPATISELSATPWKPETPVLVSARIDDLDRVEAATVQWQLVDAVGGAGRERSTPAKRVGGSDTSARYEASLSDLAASRLTSILSVGRFGGGRSSCGNN